jgi:hypothetical protein
MKILFFLEQTQSGSETELIECLSLSQLRLENIKEVKFGQKLKWKARDIRITLVAKSSGYGFGSCYFNLKLNGRRLLYLGPFNDDSEGYLRPLDVKTLIKKKFDLTLIISTSPSNPLYYKDQRLFRLESLIKKNRPSNKTNVMIFGNLSILIEWLLSATILQQKGENLNIFLPKNLSLYLQLVKMLTEYMEPILANQICEGEKEILMKGTIKLVFFKDFMMQRKDSANLLFIFEEQLLKSDWNKILFQKENYNLNFIKDNQWKWSKLSNGIKHQEKICNPNALEIENEVDELSSINLKYWIGDQMSCLLDQRYFDTVLGKQIQIEDSRIIPEQPLLKANLTNLSTTMKTESITALDSVKEDINQIKFDSANSKSFIEHCGQILFGFDDQEINSLDGSKSVKYEDEGQYGLSLTSKFFELFKEKETDLIMENEDTKENGKVMEREIGEDREEIQPNIDLQNQFNQELLMSDFDKETQTLNHRMTQLNHHFEQSQGNMDCSIIPGEFSANIETQKLVFSRLKGENVFLINSKAEETFKDEDLSGKYLKMDPVKISFSNYQITYPWTVNSEVKIKLFQFDENIRLSIVKVSIDRSIKDKSLLSFDELKTNHFWILRKNFLLGFLSFLRNSEEIENQQIQIQTGSVLYKNKVRLIKKENQHPVLEGHIGAEYLLLRSLLYKFLRFE